MDCSLLTFSVHGLFHARILEWVAISLSRGSSPTQGSNSRLSCLLQLVGGCFMCMCLVAQSCPTLCNPVDSSPPGSSVHRILCARILERVTRPSSRDLPNPGIEPGIPHCSWILYHLSHQGSPRILERIACPFHRGTSLPRNWTSVSCIAGRFFTSWATREVCGCSISEVSRVQLMATPWTVAHQAPPSMGFSRQEYWSGMPFPSPGDLPDSGIEPRSPSLQADALTSEPPGKLLHGPQQFCIQ